MDFVQACNVLFELPRFDVAGATAIHPGLKNISALLDDFGKPHMRYPIVHVAGTNGKGSVCSMIAAILTASGKRVGLHTSPHLISLTERLRVDGAPAEEYWVADAVTRMQSSIARIKPSFFEASTALALLYFAERNVDVAVVEVGMGGRLDATNVVVPQVSVITNIGFDHVQQLGVTLPEIAREKAGIIKEGIPVVTGACQPEVREVIAGVAKAMSASVVDVCDPPWDVRWDGRKVRLATPAGRLLPFRLDLPGQHQLHNALVAVGSAHLLLSGSALERSVIRGLSNVRRLSGLRARCEVVRRDPLVVVDVAHNADGMRAALACLDLEGGVKSSPYVMLGLAADKDVSAILTVLVEHGCVVLPLPIPGKRGLPAAELAKRARDVRLRIVEIDSAEDGIRYFMEHAETTDRLLVAGSHYLVGTLPEDVFPRRTSLDVFAGSPSGG